MADVLLQQFVTESLVEIAAAIRAANDQASAKLSPSERRTYFQMATRSGGKVHFDVAVTSKTEATLEGEATAKVLVVDATLEATGSTERSRVSRISFDVEVMFALT